MIDFITTHWPSIVVVLVFIAVLVFLAVKGKKDIVYKILYHLVIEAEKQFGSGTGKIKFAYVMEKAYAMLPAIIKVFITYDKLTEWIESAVAKMKEDLAEKTQSEQTEITE